MAVRRLNRMRRIAILGSTGSIGTQALDVIEPSEDLEVVGLTANSRWEQLLGQASATASHAVALADGTRPPPPRCVDGGEVLAGQEGIAELIAESGADMVLNGLVGSAGLGPTIAALGEGDGPCACEQGEPGRRAASS